MREKLLLSNRMLNDARTSYFSDLIHANHHNERFLFLNSLVNPVCAQASANYVGFLSHFTSKLESMRHGISPNPSFLDVKCPYLNILKLFKKNRAVLPESYRPISKLPVISKVLGTIVS